MAEQNHKSNPFNPQLANCGLKSVLSNLDAELFTSKELFVLDEIESYFSLKEIINNAKKYHSSDEASTSNGERRVIGKLLPPPPMLPMQLLPMPQLPPPMPMPVPPPLPIPMSVSQVPPPLPQVPPPLLIPMPVPMPQVPPPLPIPMPVPQVPPPMPMPQVPPPLPILMPVPQVPPPMPMPQVPPPMPMPQVSPPLPQVPPPLQIPMPLPQLPPPMPALPAHIRNMIRDLNGTDVRYVMCKKIFKTDLSISNNRLSMPCKEIKYEFLTEIEKSLLDTKEDKKPYGLEVIVLDPYFREFDMLLKKWTMTTSVYNLVKSWNILLKQNNWDKHTKLNHRLHI